MHGLEKKEGNQIFCFQETKLSDMIARVVRSLEVKRNLEWASLDDRKTEGEVLLMWDSRVLAQLNME